MSIMINGSKFELNSDEKSLLEFIQNKKIDINHSCGGNGTCGTCRVLVENHQNLPQRNSIEEEMANDRGFNDNERLACQNPLIDELIINTPD